MRNKAIHMKKAQIRILAIGILLLFMGINPTAAIRLPRIFSNGVVLQRGQPIPVWGWAEPGQTISISLSKQGEKAKNTISVQADNEGKWMTKLPSMKASGPFTLQVDTILIRDVWIGDVWLFSGQSNIDTDIERVYPQYPQEIDQDVNERVHLFKVENEAVLEGPVSDVRSNGWKTLSKQNAWKTTALGYFMGKQRERETGIVQGIIQCSWGGTPIESWMQVDSVAKFDPRMATEAHFYADVDLRRKINEVNGHASRRWNQTLNETDPGMSQGWNELDFDDSQWATANQYQLSVSRPFIGSYWMRQHIKVDAAHAGQSALLLLGTLVDADYTFLNGKQIGHTGYQYPPRRYRIPEGLLREGDNVITVRFVNQGAPPEFVNEKPYRIEWNDGTSLPLQQEWLVHEGTRVNRAPLLPAGFQNMAAAAYNGMLSPLMPYALSGAVWYQGESNTGKAVIYEQQLQNLMQTWRKDFAQPTLPFVIVQLANFMAPTPNPQESGWARLRESQRRAALSDPNAALAVAIDLGEANDIHPLRKKELAERVSLAFDHLINKKPTVLSPQPIKAVSTNEGTTIVTFDQPITGGVGFEISDENGTFHNVEGKAKDRQVTLRGQGKMVRYAWKDNPVEANCRGMKNDLPATPFEIEITK